MTIQLFGLVNDHVASEIDNLVAGMIGTSVFRKDAARSRNPFPASTDLEAAIKHWMMCNGFEHHPRLKHPTTQKGFEYDFFNAKLLMAVEVMGYRADEGWRCTRATLEVAWRQKDVNELRRRN